MKRIVIATLTLLVLSAIPSFAQAPVQPVSLDAIFAPAEAPAPAEAAPLDGAIFLADDQSVVVTACCRGNFAICAASCNGDVRSYTCGPAGSGCSSSCLCN